MRKFICWAFSWEALLSEEAKKNNKRSATEARRDNFAKTYFQPPSFFSRSVNARLTVRYFIVLLAEKKAQSKQQTFSRLRFLEASSSPKLGSSFSVSSSNVIFTVGFSAHHLQDPHTPTRRRRPNMSGCQPTMDCNRAIKLNGSRPRMTKSVMMEKYG